MPAAQSGDSEYSPPPPPRPDSLVDPNRSLAPQSDVSTPSPGALSAVDYAGFWIRFLAVFIDGLLLMVGQLFITIPLGIVVGMAAPNATAAERVSGILGFFVGLIVNWLYCALMMSSAKQATVGKMALGLKVTDMSGGRITFGRATGRFFAQYLSALPLLLGYLIQPFTERNQALHDLLVGTVVVRGR
jgi:uncharacterized RDD family membrane protein YckC